MARKPLIITAILIATFGMASVPVLAEEAAPGHADTHSAQDAGDGHNGHEEKALLHWDFGAALWSIAVFVVLLIILRVAAWKPILKGLNERETFIRNSLEEAKREREKAQQQQAEFEAKLQKSQQEAAAVVEEGRRDAEEMRKRIVSEAKAEAEAVADRAKREIELARNDALQKLHDQTVAISTMVAGKMIQRELNAADHESLINESIAELSKMNN
ncbi:MAG: F0F1 ATP synthase subunit B [Phycisphaerales bacterium]|nr:F0F1 ATP synthase subunit B [Phycisphaerales bacterium]MCB9858713.1 F0F1 ATP synthase subunit B [Phycisphaerales bacterium]MCB9864431.1 F0F1 ATP synthase subunit B [Phycisphaerales bacterium]